MPRPYRVSVAEVLSCHPESEPVRSRPFRVSLASAKSFLRGGTHRAIPLSWWIQHLASHLGWSRLWRGPTTPQGKVASVQRPVPGRAAPSRGRQPSASARVRWTATGREDRRGWAPAEQGSDRGSEPEPGDGRVTADPPEWLTRSISRRRTTYDRSVIITAQPGHNGSIGLITALGLLGSHGTEASFPLATWRGPTRRAAAAGHPAEVRGGRWLRPVRGAALVRPAGGGGGDRRWATLGRPRPRPRRAARRSGRSPSTAPRCWPRTARCSSPTG
jgi:hypothetical protein